MVWHYPEPVFGCHFFKVSCSLSFEDVLHNILSINRCVRIFIEQNISVCYVRRDSISDIFHYFSLFSCYFRLLRSQKKYGQYLIHLAQSTRKTRWRRLSVVQFLPAANKAHQDWFTGFFVDIALEKLQNHLFAKPYALFALWQCSFTCALLGWKEGKKSTFWSILQLFVFFCFCLEYRKNLFLPLFIWRMLKAKSNRVVQHIKSRKYESNIAF